MCEKTRSSKHVQLQPLERRMLLCAELHGSTQTPWHRAIEEQMPARPGGPAPAPASGFGFAGAFRAGGGAQETGTTIATDAAGNLYLAGTFSGVFDVSPGSGVPALVSAGDIDGFVAKYSPQRTLLWSVAIGGIEWDGSDSIAVDGDGSVYVTGSFYEAATIRAGHAPPVSLTGAGAIDAYLIKLNGGDGTVSWARQIGGAGNEGGAGIVLDGAGGAYLASYGPSGATSGNDPAAAFVTRFDAAGATVWTRQRGDATTPPTIPTDIAFDPAGALVVVGWSYETAPRPGFAWKLSPGDGASQWERQWSGTLATSYNIARGVAIDGSGNILITGSFNGAIDFNPSPGTEFKLTSRTCRDKPGGMLTCTSGYSSDIYVLKLQADGTFAWAGAMGGEARGDDIAFDVSTDADGNAYTTGYFYDKADFDPSGGRFEITAKGVSSGDWLTDELGVSDTFVSKLDSTGKFVWALAVGGSNAAATGDGGYGIAVGDDRRVHATGFFRGAGDFDPTAGVHTLTSSGGTDAFDTRTDVYSLGVILYELLLAQPTHDLSGDSMEVRRRVAEEDVRSPRAADRQLASDLEAILLHALERNPAERYGSAAEFADDIRRFLDDQPVKARKRTAAYVMRKWLRRHRYRSAVGLAFAVVLAAGAVWSYVSIAHQRDRATTQAAITDAVIRFILEKLLTAPDPAVAQGREPTLRELLDRASDEVPTAFPDQPLVEAAVRQTLGQVYLNLHDLTRAGAHIEAAYHLCRESLGDDHPTTLRAATLLAFHYEGLYQLDRAARLLDDTLERQRRVLPDGHPDILASVHRLANVRAIEGRFAEAEPLLRQAWHGRRSKLGESHADTIWSLSDLGAVLTALGRAHDSEPLLREALRLRRATQGDRHIDTLNAELNLATNLMKLGKLDEAAALLVANARVRKEVMGNVHPARTLPLQALADLRRRQGLPAEAEALFREAFDLAHRALPGNIETLRSRLGLVETLASLGRRDEVDEHLRELASMAEGKDATTRIDAMWLTTYASAIAALDRRDEAIELLRRAVAANESASQPDEGTLQLVQNTLARVAADRGTGASRLPTTSPAE